MKIALAQVNFKVGDLGGNEGKIRASISRAREAGADLVAFPELAICGYPPMDLLDFDSFVDQCIEKISVIAKAFPDIGIIIGGPNRNPSKGKRLFNTAFFLYGGKIRQTFNKALLPTYDIFDEYRYFEPDPFPKILEFKGKKIALTICEDLWNLGNHPLYKSCPMDMLAGNRPDLMLNIAASPFSYEQKEQRKGILKKNVEKYRLPLLYVNHVGAQTQLIFDGGSLVMNPDGTICDEMLYFREDLKIFDLGSGMPCRISEPTESTYTERIGFIHEALVMGIRDYFSKSGLKKAVIGLSGGVDSALVTVLAVQALGKENVTAIMLPSEFSSDHSISDSVKLASNLGVRLEEIPVKDIYNSFGVALEPYFKGLPFNVAEENLQARIRGTLLMAWSNKFGDILLNTTNKSEMAVGYGTLYGDMCGGLSVIGDVYKTEVYDLCRWINGAEEIIPENILTKEPSAELRPGQKDTDSLPEYDILDKLLYQYIEENKSRKELIDMGFSEELTSRVIRMVNRNEYKRFQAAPVLRVSPKAFGTGRRMPIVASFDF